MAEKRPYTETREAAQAMLTTLAHIACNPATAQKDALECMKWLALQESRHLTKQRIAGHAAHMKEVLALHNAIADIERRRLHRWSEAVISSVSGG